MKRNILFIAVLAFLVMGCHNQNTKTTDNDVKKTDSELSNENQVLNSEAVAEAVASYIKYVDENPGAADAADYLFKAASLSIESKQNAEQSINLVNRLLEGYPEYDNNSAALFMLAAFVYDEQQQDLDKARETYQRIIDDYPDSPFVNDAAISITQLGMTPDELVKMFEETEN